MTLIKCIKEYASKPDLLKVTSLSSMMVNSTAIVLGLEPFGHFRYYVPYVKYDVNGLGESLSLNTEKSGPVLAMFMKTKLQWRFMT